MSEPTLNPNDTRRVLWRLVQMMQRIAEDVLPDPVRYGDLTPEMVRDAFIRAWHDRQAEMERLRGSRKQCRCGEDDFDPYRHDACYNCRQKDFERLERAEARLAKLVEALKSRYLAIEEEIKSARRDPYSYEDEEKCARLYSLQKGIGEAYDIALATAKGEPKP